MIRVINLGIMNRKIEVWGVGLNAINAQRTGKGGERFNFTLGRVQSLTLPPFTPVPTFDTLPIIDYPPLTLVGEPARTTSGIWTPGQSYPHIIYTT
jgi:hypothetical protein